MVEYSSAAYINDIQMDRKKGSFACRANTTVCRYNLSTNTLTTLSAGKRHSRHGAGKPESGNGDMWFGTSDGHHKRVRTLPMKPYQAECVLNIRPQMLTCLM